MLIQINASIKILHEHHNRRMILKMSLLQSSLPQNYIFLQMVRVKISINIVFPDFVNYRLLKGSHAFLKKIISLKIYRLITRVITNFESLLDIDAVFVSV